MFEKLFGNIGKKIKGFAIAIFVIEAIVAVIAGIAMLHDTDGLSFLLVVAGPIVAWLSSLILYGFGELIDKTCEIAENTIRR